MEQAKTDMRKALAVLMSLFLVLAFTPMAFTQTADAAADKTIKITDTKANSTYEAYKVFDVTQNGKSYSYTIGEDNPFYQAVADSGKFTLKQIGSSKVYNVTVKGEDELTEADAAELAKAFAAVDPKGTAAASGKANSDGDAVTLKVEAGYYFVTTTTGTVCSLGTTDNDNAVEIKDKNDKPSVDKEVQEDSNSNWGNSDDASIGETVNFQTTIDTKPGAKGYVLHDEMSKGLTFDGTVTVVNKNGNETVEAENYTLKTGGLSDDCTFELVFDDDFLKDLGENDDLVVSYAATVNADAVIAGEGNPNTTYLKYGENNKTEKDTTKTFVWDFDVLKYANGDQNAPLAGATFALSQGSTQLAFTKVADNQYKLDPKGDVTEFTTDATGKIKLIGLDSDTYTLTETAAPAGYNKLEQPVEVVIASTGSKPADVTLGYKVSQDGADTDVVGINNQSGGTLPSTGGMGTTILYIVGGVIVVAAVIVLVARRRSKTNA